VVSVVSESQGNSRRNRIATKTALSLHELSDIMPSKLHMTVPKKFRRNSQIPEILVLHRADLNQGDMQDAHGVRVTRPLRTILDLLETGRVDERHIGQAIDERTDLQRLRRQIAFGRLLARLFP
jgi:predicted transcriptional regulator of viral defense system